VNRVVYRISDTGYEKVKPSFVNNEACLSNAVKAFSDWNWNIIADNTSQETNTMIEKYIPIEDIQYVNVGNGAGTFNLGLDLALRFDYDDIVYFVENDYLHLPDSSKILLDAFELGFDYVTLYDHPDKYIDGINPLVSGGSEETRLYLGKYCHYKLTNSTTMTFAARVRTLVRDEPILRKWTNGTHPHDFQMFLNLIQEGKRLAVSIPGRSTHGETAFLTPLVDWSKV